MTKFPLDSIDSVMIVDANFNVVHAMRIENSLSGKGEVSYDSCTGQNLFNIYPDISISDSSYTEASDTCRPVFRSNQKYRDYRGKVHLTNNLTVPLLYHGKVTGFVGLSKDITSIKNIAGEIPGNELQPASTACSYAEDIRFSDILTRSARMAECVKLAERLSSLRDPVLIYGETGTGKEMFAQAIINKSRLPRKNIVTQNCAAIPDNLIESILFGTTKGSFTGSENKTGLFKLAQDGILFLDELNSLPYHIQGNLLRVLQDGTYRPVGADTEKKTNARVIATMNINPLEAIKKHILRKDLFYRFSNGLISIPPLRDRREDIELYLSEYIAKYSVEHKKTIKMMTPELKRILTCYDYDGNVRELKHIVNFMVNDADSNVLDVKNLPVYMADIINDVSQRDPGRDSGSALPAETPYRGVMDLFSGPSSLRLTDLLETAEQATIREALRRSNGNVSDAAILLDISRQSLNYKIKKYKISKDNYKIWRRWDSNP